MTTIEAGDKIGYHPVGAPDARVVGIVKCHYPPERGLINPKPDDPNNIGVIVTMPDDPGIEERVPYDRIEAHNE